MEKIAVIIAFAFIALIWMVNIDSQRSREYDLSMAKLGYCQMPNGKFAPAMWQPCEVKK